MLVNTFDERKDIMKNKLILSVITAAIVTIAWGIVSENTLFDISSGITRLHIVANSNSETDQTLKLKVRDRLLCEDVGKINGDLSKIKEVCENEITENGFEYSVSADYGTYYFPSRTYENITLPAGDYRAIKVIIGEGKGENWWCVMYPPLCYSGATDGKLSEEKMNLLKNCMDKESFELIENSGIKIKPSLKIVELWQKIRHKFLA